MVIPGNLSSQLRVLDSSQQLYAPLFLASYCSSTNTLSLKTLRKTPQFLHNAVHSPFQKTSSRFFFFFFSSVSVLPFRKPPLFLYNAVPSPFSKNLLSFPGFAFPTISAAATFCAPLLLQPPFLLSHLRPLMVCGTPFQKVPPRVKVLLQLQKARWIPYGH